MSFYGLEVQPFLPSTVTLFLIVVFRYFLIAGFFYALCYKWKRVEWASRRVIKEPPPSGIIKTEIKWSVITSIFFALSGSISVEMWKLGWTKFYFDVDDFGYLYFFLSIGIYMSLHEIYFYVTHRVLHWPWLYKNVHYVHHLSKNPTPWAAFSFHPTEAVIEAIILPILVMLVPIHPVAFLIFLTVMTVLGVTNHLGYELYPPGTATNWFGRWWIGAVHHTQHHSLVRYNYGLYFTFLDVWLGTENKNYPEVFEKVRPRK